MGGLPSWFNMGSNAQNNAQAQQGLQGAIQQQGLAQQMQQGALGQLSNSVGAFVSYNGPKLAFTPITE